MVVYLVALANLSVAYPEFYPIAAGIGSSIKTKQNIKIKKWMDGLKKVFIT